MSQGVIFIGELVRHKVFVGIVVKNFVGHSYRAIGAFPRGRKDDLGAERFEDVPAFGADTFRQGEFDAIALGCPNHSQGNSHIAGGGFENGLVFCKLAGLLGLIYHIKSGAVLNRAAGIIAFELGKDFNFAVPRNVL